MKKKRELSWRLLLLFMPLLFCVSCDDDDDDIDIGNLSAEEFVQRAAASDSFEIQTGNLALQKSTMTEVREFAQEIINDHTASSQELMSLAQQKNIQMPTTLPEDKQNKVNRLSGLSGTEFDKAFSDEQEEAHEEAVELYEQAAEDLEDADLRAFAQRTLPVLRMHLEHARTLDDLTDDL
jgi:putative membrane protein